MSWCLLGTLTHSLPKLFAMLSKEFGMLAQRVACPLRVTCTKTRSPSAGSTYMHTNSSKSTDLCMKTLYVGNKEVSSGKQEGTSHAERLLMQEMVDNIPEDKKWECPECASVKIERRKVAVERARLKRVAQGRALPRSATQCCSHFPILPPVLLSIKCVLKHKLVCPNNKINKFLLWTIFDPSMVATV